MVLNPKAQETHCKQPEGCFCATSDDIQGLVAQGKTLWETVEIARDVARKIIESQTEKAHTHRFHAVKKHMNMPLALEV